MTDQGPDRAPDGDGGHSDEEKAAVRAELLPEEIAAGSDDPLGQAEAILEESEERTEHPQAEIRRHPDETAAPEL